MVAVFLNLYNPEVSEMSVAFSFLGELVNLQKARTISFVMSVRLSAWNNSSPTGRIFMESDIRTFLEILSRKFKFHINRTRITGTLHEAQYTFLIISRPVLLRMRKKCYRQNCRENLNTYFK
jgi:hypothetical protein